MNSQIKTIQAPYLSIVIPIYNEVDNIDRLWQALSGPLAQTGKTYEVILVDDGSSDGSREALRKLAAEHPAIRVILFRANFGQSAAMAAGFEATRGQVVIAMDGDLQNDPQDIDTLLQKLDEGYDVVSGWRKNRRDKLLLRKIPSKIANKLICSMTDVRLHDTGCSLKAFRGDLLRRISLYGELHRFIPALLRIEGAQITEMPVRHHPRRFGKSKYNLTRTFRVIMDLITIRLLMRHLHNPLSFFSNISIACFFAGTLTFAKSIYEIIRHDAAFAELNILATLTVLLWATGVQFMFLGLVGKLIVESGSRKTFYLYDSD
jgi:glycosyltransferase involved in cell wall biosynthesis